MKERTSHLRKLKDEEHSDGKHGVQECCDLCLVGGFCDAEDSRQNRWLILLGNRFPWGLLLPCQFGQAQK